MNATKPIALGQKFSILVTVIIGLILFISYQFGSADPGTLTTVIFFYSLAVCISFLAFETFVDLNDQRVFNIWLAIGIAQFAVYLLTRDNTTFQFYKNANFNPYRGIGLYISDMATSSLKTLLIFLLSFKLLNEIMKKLTGNNVLNAFNQTSWKHSFTRRRITWLDVAFNVILFAIILVSTFIY